MEADATALLARIIREVRVAALGTLRQGAPLVSMVAFLPEPDFGGFCLRISRLAWHTQDMLTDPRVSLSIVEPDEGRGLGAHAREQRNGELRYVEITLFIQ